MPEVIRDTLTRAEIDDLAEKLDELGKGLSDKERKALSAVFGMASQAAAQHVSPGGTGATQEASSEALPPLSTSFEAIFQPGLGAGMEGEEMMADGGQVGVQVSWTR